MLPNVSKSCIDILNKMLLYDENERWSAAQLLKHKWFDDINNVDISQLNSSFDDMDLSISMSEPYIGNKTGREAVGQSVLSNKFELNGSNSLLSIQKKKYKMKMNDDRSRQSQFLRRYAPSQVIQNIRTEKSPDLSLSPVNPTS